MNPLSENPSLAQKIAQTRAKALERCPASAKGILARSLAKNASPRDAIKSQCLECLGYDRKAIAECTSWACPLWEYRPFQKK